ncbi:hypothetical protein BTRA_3491 [Burkholderia thailandensis USAMRU Malaysia |nr:hypothetical protein BTJ_5027 [Burkholderia thailandensis E444]AIC89356.1 hypothetical protein BTRA_3491 [Burkholderia thailandensis USAMRU Malaysia \
MVADCASAPDAAPGGRAARRRRTALPIVFPLYDNTRESDSGTVTNKGKPFLTARKVIRSHENAACHARIARIGTASPVAAPGGSLPIRQRARAPGKSPRPDLVGIPRATPHRRDGRPCRTALRRVYGIRYEILRKRRAAVAADGYRDAHECGPGDDQRRARRSSSSPAAAGTRRMWTIGSHGATSAIGAAMRMEAVGSIEPTFTPARSAVRPVRRDRGDRLDRGNPGKTGPDGARTARRAHASPGCVRAGFQPSASYSR